MKLFNNLKMKMNSIKFNKFGKSKTLILPNTKRELKIEDGYYLTLIRKNLF